MGTCVSTTEQPKWEIKNLDHNIILIDGHLHDIFLEMKQGSYEGVLTRKLKRDESSIPRKNTPHEAFTEI